MELTLKQPTAPEVEAKVMLTVVALVWVKVLSQVVFLLGMALHQGMGLVFLMAARPILQVVQEDLVPLQVIMEDPASPERLMLAPPLIATLYMDLLRASLFNRMWWLSLRTSSPAQPCSRKGLRS